MSFHVAGNMTAGELGVSLEKLEKRLDTLDDNLQTLNEEMSKLPETLAVVITEALREYRNNS